MSCRVISRTVEHFLFAGVSLNHCRNQGVAAIVGEYIPTKKNAVVASLFDELGFERSEDRADDGISYKLGVAGAAQPKTFVRLEGQGREGEL